VAIGAVLFGLALASQYIIALGANIYAQMANMTISVPLGDPTAELKYAYNVYHAYFSNATTDLGIFFGIFAVTNSLPFVQGYGMALIQVGGPVLTALSTILILSGTYAAASLMAMGWAPLAALGAVGVAYERTRGIGSFALSLASVLPPTLAIGAESISNAVPPSALEWPSGLSAALTAGLTNIGNLITLAMYLSVLGIVLSAVVYGFSRIFDEAGHHFALE
jgi:hypothetical protein